MASGRREEKGAAAGMNGGVGGGGGKGKAREKGMDNGSKGRARRREQRQSRQMEGRDADPSNDALVGVPPWWQQQRHRSSQRENGVAGREKLRRRPQARAVPVATNVPTTGTPRCCVRQPQMTRAGRVLEATRDGPTQQCARAPRLIRGEEFSCLILPRGLLQYLSSNLLSSL